MLCVFYRFSMHTRSCRLVDAFIAPEVVLNVDSRPVPSEVHLDPSLKTNRETMVEDTQNPDDRTEEDSKHTPYMQTNTFRLHLLKVIARHSRYVTFSIALSAEQLWIRFGDHLLRLRWHGLPDI